MKPPPSNPLPVGRDEPQPFGTALGLEQAADAGGGLERGQQPVGRELARQAERTADVLVMGEVVDERFFRRDQP